MIYICICIIIVQIEVLSLSLFRLVVQHETLHYTCEWAVYIVPLINHFNVFIDSKAERCLLSIDTIAAGIVKRYLVGVFV
jgi:hypothetical protein